MCVCVCVCVHVRVRVHACLSSLRFGFVFWCLCVFPVILYVNCFGRTVLYMCIEYRIKVDIYHVSAQDVDERMIMYIIIIIIIIKICTDYLPFLQMEIKPCPVVV